MKIDFYYEIGITLDFPVDEDKLVNGIEKYINEKFEERIDEIILNKSMKIIVD